MITKDWIIADVMAKYPELVEVMEANGIHCAGCGASGFETLEEGVAGHGVDVDAFVTLLNDSILDKSEPFIISDGAAQMVKNLCEGEGKHALRVQVLRGGCSGYKYDFSLVDTAVPGDNCYHNGDVKVYVPKDSMDRLGGAVLEYKHALSGAGFVVSNPNASRSCGCGKSFS